MSSKPDHHKPSEPEVLTIAQAFAEHRSVLASYLAQKLVSQTDIDDLLQETFAQAFNAEKKGKIDSPKGYLFTVARNLLSRKFVRQAREMRKEISDVEFFSLPANTVLADRDLHYKMKLSTLDDAIKTLPPQCQKVFIMRKITGLSQKQIARKLNISTSTVERHITIALSRLNVVMRAQGYNQSGENKGAKQLKGSAGHENNTL